MNEYTPHKWLVIEIKGKEFPLTYKVFASWHGGYLDGDSWKLNSGIKKITKEGDFYLFTGHSESVYACHKKCYGSHMYGNGVLNAIIQKAKEGDVTIQVLPENQNWLDLIPLSSAS